MAGAGEGGRGLDQKRGLADARLAAEKKRRTANETAAGDAIEFGYPGLEARCLFADTVEPLKLNEPPRPRRDGTALGDGGGGRFLDDGVPLVAALALAGPAIVQGPAVLTDEGGSRFGRESLRERRMPDIRSGR